MYLTYFYICTQITRCLTPDIASHGIKLSGAGDTNAQTRILDPQLLLQVLSLSFWGCRVSPSTFLFACKELALLQVLPKGSITLATSQTGSTLYMEPKPVMQLNNAASQLADQVFRVTSCSGVNQLSS